VTTPLEPDRLTALLFDGQQARARPAQVWVAAGQLHWAVDGLTPRSTAMSTAVWPERQRHGQRQVQLPDGGVLVFEDAAVFDRWVHAAGRADGGVVRWQQSWRLTSLALVLVMGCLLLLWRWGIPAAANAAVALLPDAAVEAIGQHTLGYLSDQWLKPSKLDPQTQADVVQRFEAAARAARQATGPQPVYRILLRDGGRLGPNAFALPGGDIAVTDALVTMLKDEPQAVVGVLAHELGHIRHQHGLRQAAQSAGAGVVAGLVMGDFSFLMSTIPALMAQMTYSRDFEREADLYARDLLRGAGIDPRVMVRFFERIERVTGGGTAQGLPIAFSSHPATAERIAFFSQR
jgi:Zn-dependent protease with chaperone function